DRAPFHCRRARRRARSIRSQGNVSDLPAMRCPSHRCCDQGRTGLVSGFHAIHARQDPSSLGFEECRGRRLTGGEPDMSTVGMSLERPKSLDEVVALLGEPGVRILNGGTEITRQLVMGESTCSTLVDIKGVEELSGVEAAGDRL